MLSWGVGLRLVHHWIPLKSLVRLSVPDHPIQGIAPDYVLRYIAWLDSNGLFGIDGYCLVRALVLYRFLSLAGMAPTLLIGFRGSEGHAWVEVEGNAVFEEDPTINDYQPTLILMPGSRTLIQAT